MKSVRRVLKGLGVLLLIGVTLTAVSFLNNRRLPTASQTVDRLSDAELARIAEFYQLRQQLGANVWPGWDTAVIPVIVYNEAYAFLLNFSDPPDGWIKIPQDEARGGAWEQVPNSSFNGEIYYRQPLPNTGETPEAFTVRVGDRWVASMPTMEWMEIELMNRFREEVPTFLQGVFPYEVVTRLFLRGSDGYISLLAHESFHAFQGMSVPDRLEAAETAVVTSHSSYPWEVESFQENWQIEFDFLHEAVQAEKKTERVELTRQFLTQRALRRQEAGLNADLIDYEMQREWSEGLARFVELEIWKQAALAEAYQPVPALLADRKFSEYQRFDLRWSQEVDQIGRMAYSAGDGRFYYSGVAQAVLLDELMSDWKTEIFEADVFLEDLLETAVFKQP